MISRVLVIIVSCFCLGSTGLDHEVLSDWKVDREEDGIEISYRYLMVGDTFKTREMRIIFDLTSSVTDLMPMYRDPELFAQWSTGIERCEVLEEDSLGWTMYNLYDIPWPFKTRDLVTRYDESERGGKTTLVMTSEPEKYPVEKGIMRMKKYEGSWTFTSNPDGGTSVEMRTVAFSKPVAPRFIQDPIVQRAFIKSIGQLKTLLDDEG